MNAPAQLPDFNDLQAALERINAQMGAAESHGLLCGLACVQGSVDEKRWLAQVMADSTPGDVLGAEAETLLSGLYSETARQFGDESLSFELLLPAEGDPLSLRAEALGQWCQGFLFGYALAGGSAETAADETAEILRDLSEIAKVQFEVMDNNEEDEGAYAEVVEYVRMGVLLIYESALPAAGPQVRDTRQLH